MSEHHQFICPRDFHLAPPDWPALQARLLDGGYLLEARGKQVPYRALSNLGFGLARFDEGTYQHPHTIDTPSDLLAQYVDAGALPDGLSAGRDASLDEVRALLASHGITPDPLYDDHEGSDWHSPQYCLGPAARPYLSDHVRAGYDADPREVALMLLAYDTENPLVAVGENLSEPSLPGVDEPLATLPPFESHVDFIGAAFDNPGAQWHCAENGLDYRILELDWHYSLAMGFRLLRAEGLDRESAEGLAALIAELTGQPMVCSHRHL